MKLIFCAALASIGFASYGAQPLSATETFSRLKGLVGKWEQGTGDNKLVVEYRLTSGGSTLMETISPGSPHEMVSMYHLDKDRLLMTHYCAASNQPTMKHIPGPDPKVFHFEFVSGTNMGPMDFHMHKLTISLLEDNHIKEDWQVCTGGKMGATEKFDLHRG